MDVLENFAANLRKLRHEKGLSQEALAYAADINRTYISKLEKGTCYPGLEIIGKLANELGVSPDMLLKKATAKKRTASRKKTAKK